MKIAVLSDVHGNIAALEKIAKSLKKDSIDKIVFLGDLIMTGPRPLEVFELLSEMNPDVWIKGNTDDWLAELPDFKPVSDLEKMLKDMGLWAQERINNGIEKELLSKPISIEKIYSTQCIHFCHGTPSSHSLAFLPENKMKFLDTELIDVKADKIICGHTHIRFMMSYRNKLIKNFGAVSMPGKDFSRMAHYGIIHIADTICFEDRECEYNFMAYIDDLKTLNYPGNSLILPKYGL